jgi:hypothetical protein
MPCEEHTVGMIAATVLHTVARNTRGQRGRFAPAASHQHLVAPGSIEPTTLPHMPSHYLIHRHRP